MAGGRQVIMSLVAMVLLMYMLVTMQVQDKMQPSSEPSGPNLIDQLDLLKFKQYDDYKLLHQYSKNLSKTIVQLSKRLDKLESNRLDDLEKIGGKNILKSSTTTNNPSSDYKFSILDNHVVFPDQPLKATIWIDVPNSFPWRHCLHEYSDMVFTYGCNLVKSFETTRQTMIIRSMESDRTKFQVMLAEKNTGMDKLCLEPDQNKVIKVVKICSSGFWRWTNRGLLKWGEEGCLASTGGQAKTLLVECDHTYDDQIVEIGRVTLAGKNSTLEPLDMDFWQRRMDLGRSEEMAAAKKEVDAVLEEIKEMEEKKEFEIVEGNRRAVVFYVDKGSGFLAYLTWWMFTWRQIGLDSQKEAFDIILMTHPQSINKLPSDCVKVPEDFDPQAPGAGQCLYKELVPISERNHRYDNYLNSQECLTNPAASFLKKYKIVMRADLDTFPTPGMVNFWPRDVICYRNAGTNHHKKNIEDAIVATAEAAGIEHHHWHDTDSAWMGPALRVITLAKLTTHLSRFLRVHMFGPGTQCRCATCMDLPEDCKWGQGIYAGTMLLYSQEIAMNRLWSKREYDENNLVVLDGSCTDVNVHVCQVALLHARHNADPFSKFTFLRGDYKTWDNSELDITNVQGYAMYMSTASAGQGVNTSQAMDKYQTKSEGVPLAELCTGRTDWPGIKWI